MSHKDNCEWETFGFHLYNSNPDGPDETIAINETGIFYDSNVTNPKDTKEDFSCIFKFCPYCGVEL